jgi:hypothetical protein
MLRAVIVTSAVPPLGAGALGAAEPAGALGAAEPAGELGATDPAGALGADPLASGEPLAAGGGVTDGGGAKVQPAPADETQAERDRQVTREMEAIRAGRARRISGDLPFVRPVAAGSGAASGNCSLQL